MRAWQLTGSSFFCWAVQLGSAPGILVHSETQTEAQFHLKVCDSFQPPVWFLHTLGLLWAALILVSVWGEGGSVISAPWGHREHLGERLGKLLSVTQAEFPTKSRPWIQAKWAPGTEHQTKLTETKLWFLKLLAFSFENVLQCGKVFFIVSNTLPLLPGYLGRAATMMSRSCTLVARGSGHNHSVRRERKQEEMHQAKIPSPAGAFGIPCDRRSPVGFKYPLIKILLLLARASVL